MTGDHTEPAEPAAPAPAPAQALPPETGDPDIDAVLDHVATAQGGDLADRIAAGEHAHDALQSRLRDLGGA